MNREVIKRNKKVFDAWLSGEEVQHQLDGTDNWHTNRRPSWCLGYNYRIKPKPREYYLVVHKNWVIRCKNHEAAANLKSIHGVNAYIKKILIEEEES